MIRYIGNTISVALNVLLVIGILGYFGVETTSFAALIAALGIAIGAAWGGLLSNFAAGAFILVLRPFKVGDFVEAGDVTGTVRAIGLFVTTIDTPDNVQTYVGNAKILGGTIQNFTTNPYRRVDLTAQLDHTVDPRDAIRAAEGKRCRRSRTWRTSRRPTSRSSTSTSAAPVLAVRPYVHNDHYWQVYFDTNQAIKATLRRGRLPGAGGIHSRTSGLTIVNTEELTMGLLDGLLGQVLRRCGCSQGQADGRGLPDMGRTGGREWAGSGHSGGRRWAASPAAGRAREGWNRSWAGSAGALAAAMGRRAAGAR